MKNTVTRIVLLGGGYVSIWAYRSLIKILRREIASGQVQVTVICPEKYHFYHGWTAESLTCIIQDQNRMSPLNKVFSKACFIHGKVEEINSIDKSVNVKGMDGSMQLIQYDHLVLGIGSFDSEEVEGLHQNGYQVKSHEAFKLTRQTIQRLVTEAAHAETVVAQRLLTFMIAGAGFTGVELATNIAEFIAVLKKQYPSLQKIKPVIRVINSGDRILNVLPSRFNRLVRYTEKTMRNYGIEVLNNSRIEKITGQGAYLKDGSFIGSSMVISTIGQSRMIVKGTENMLRDNLKRVYTNSYLQLRDHSNIWGGGDACHVMQYNTKKACPTNALWAIKHGEYLGRNIAKAIKEQPLQKFTYKGLGQTASLGIGKGIGEIYGIQFTGWIAWIMRFFVFNYFMPSRKVMFHEIGDWLFLLFRRQRKGLFIQKKIQYAPHSNFLAFPAD